MRTPKGFFLDNTAKGLGPMVSIVEICQHLVSSKEGHLILDLKDMTLVMMPPMEVMSPLPCDG